MAAPQVLAQAASGKAFGGEACVSRGGGGSSLRTTTAPARTNSHPASPLLTSAVPPHSPSALSRLLAGRSPSLIGRRVSLVSVPVSAPASPLVTPTPSTPATRTQVPTLRDLRSAHYQTRICGQNAHLVHVLRAALQGSVQVTPEGRVLELAQAPPSPTIGPAGPFSPAAAASASVGPTAASAETSAPAGDLLGRRGSGDSSSRRVFVGLSVGPSHGRPYWEGKVAWPVEGCTDSAESVVTSATLPSSHLSTPGGGGGGGGGSTPSTPRGPLHQLSSEALVNRQLALQQLLLNLASHLPALPAGLVAPARETQLAADPPHTPPSSASASASAATPAAATASTPNSSSTSLSDGGAASSARLLRRPSASFEEAWCDGEVVASVFLLVDPIDVDSKQLTFLAAWPAAHGGRACDQEALFQALYKVDLTAPSPAAAPSLARHHAPFSPAASTRYHAPAALALAHS